jgi:hypothetical protein
LSPVVVEPTSQVIRLDITPATTWVLPAVDACARTTGEIDLSVREISTRAVDPGEADLLILSGDTVLSSEKAFIIGEIPLSVIVHPDNPLEQLSPRALTEVFSGQVRQWVELGSSLPEADIQVWLPPQEDDLWDALVEGVLTGKEPSRLARFAPDPQAMRAAVAADEFAVGVLPAAYLDQTVRAVETPLDLRLPVLAVSPDEPAGLIRDFLLCLQEEIK